MEVLLYLTHCVTSVWCVLYVFRCTIRCTIIIAVRYFNLKAISLFPGNGGYAYVLFMCLCFPCSMRLMSCSIYKDSFSVTTSFKGKRLLI